MKKLITVLAALTVVVSLNAQSLNEIVKKFSQANKQDKISSLSTIKISARMSMMGMDLPMEMWMKKPDKIKTVTSLSGQQMISAFDGTKGYTINPMTGSSTPVEMSAEEIKQTQNNNMFKNILDNYLKEGKLNLVGEENVNNSPAFKIKAELDGGISSVLFIDKVSYLMTKNISTINQNGVTMVVESYPTDYKEIGGIILPMKTITSAQGMEMTLYFDKVEVNIPMDDSIFKLK